MFSKLSLGISMDWLAWNKQEKEDNILGCLEQANNAGRVRVEYILAIIDEMDKKMHCD